MSRLYADFADPRRYRNLLALDLYVSGYRIWEWCIWIDCDMRSIRERIGMPAFRELGIF